MKPPAAELERRRPVWEALSAVFLDTEIDDAWRDEIVDVLLAAGYTQSELERILWEELCPVLHVNLQSVAGEWSGFDRVAVESQILHRPAGRLRQWWAYLNGGYLAHRGWRRIKVALASRSETRPTGEG